VSRSSGKELKTDDPMVPVKIAFYQAINYTADSLRRKHLSPKQQFFCFLPCRINPARLFVSIDYSASRKVIRGNLYQYLVARKDTDEMKPHFARNMGENPVPVVELDPEHGVRKRFNHFSPYFYDIIFIGHAVSSSSLLFISIKARQKSLKSPCVNFSFRHDALRYFVKMPSCSLQVDRVFCLGFRGCKFHSVRKKNPSSVL